MTSQQSTSEFERVFGESIDSFLDNDKDLDFSEICETKERLNALIQLFASDHDIPGWSGGLRLGFNGIGAAGAKDLATMLAKNTTIHTLNLTYNRIEAVGAKYLATMLETNTTIHTLGVSSNDIGPVGAKDLATMLEKNTTIHRLYLGNNEIGAALKDLVTILEKNTTIHELLLYDNKIGAAGAKDLATVLEKNTTIHTLDLHNNRIGPVGAKDLAMMLEKNTTIHTLGLGDNNIGDAGTKDLATMLKKNATIHTLNLENNEIGAAGAKDLAKMLAKNTTIHTLTLEDNDIGAAGVQDLATMLEKNIVVIQTLFFEDNEIGAAGVKDLAPMLEKNTTIQMFGFENTNIGDAGAKYVAKMLEKNTTVHTLLLASNGIGAAGVKDLTTMLEKNTTIQAFIFVENGIGAGAKDLAMMLEKNTTIHRLSLCLNGIGTEGVQDLATMLGKNTTLHTLCLDWIGMTYRAVNYLATMLGKNTTIHTLQLSQNNIGDAEVKDLATMLEKNTTIHTLDLEDNNIGAVGAKDLATMLAKNTTVHTLTLESNDIGKDGVKAFEQMLEKNVIIQKVVLNAKEFRQSIANALARNKDGTAALQHAFNLQNIQTVELMLEKHHKKLDIEKGFLSSIWHMVSQHNPKQTTCKILVDLAIQSDASDLLPELLPHLDKASLAHVLPRLDEAALHQLLPHLDAVALAQLLPHLVEAALVRLLHHLGSAALAQLLSCLDKDALAHVLPHLDESALAQLLPHLDEAAVAYLLSHLDEAAVCQLLHHLDESALAQLRTDSRPEIKSMVDIALTPVSSLFDPSRLAQQLTSLLALPSDVFAENGTPLPSIFLEHASANISKRHIDFAAAAVRCLLERQHKHEIQTWVDAHPDANTLMTGLDVTKSAEKHLQRYADTPLDLQQANASLDRMVVPAWYDQVLVQPAVEAVRNQLEHRRVAALANKTQTDTCQKLANESLKADRLLYGGALSKAQQQNRAATKKMELLAEQKQAHTQGKWATNIYAGKPQRPTHPNMSASVTVAQVKLQAIQQGDTFRKVIESIRVATGLTLSMVEGSVDRDSGLLVKHKDGVDTQGSFYMSKCAYRIAQKWWKLGNVGSICDINRALLVADTFEDLCKAAEHIFSRSDMRIVDIKDRVNNPTYGGWSDLVLLFSVEGTSGHIHELQLALKPLMVAREGMAAHEAYARARYFVEMLEKCGLEYDSESSESKLQKTNEKLKNVIEGQKRPGRSLYGWLQQADGKAKKWKRRWFVLNNGLLTYHNNKVKSSLTTSERLKVAKGAAQMVTSSIYLDTDPNEVHKFEIINKTERMHLHLDKSNKQAPPDETHTRTEWVDAMMSHTGCKMYTRADWADTMLMT